VNRAALGSFVFLVAAPGVIAGVIPYGLTGWESEDPPLALQIAGVVLLAAGLPVLLDAFVRFVREGRGTPAPVAPTERLVVGGLYRYVRNPMYLAVGAIIAGQALLLGRPVLLAWLAVFAAAVLAFVKLYEEPTLARTYGDEYERYKRDVPGWWPRRIEKT
jgi:protein-S-isoprenylcysteine O-methyltransferase Ste14